VRKLFSEYFRLSEAETKGIWDEAVFVFDTNVLLNLYRMSQATSLAIRNILKKLTGRLFLPHQVGVEFLRHREEEIAKQVNAFERVRDFLKKIPEKFKQEFSRHPCIPITGIFEALKKCTDKQITIVSASQKENQLNFLIHDDPILPELDILFAGCCEEPYTGTEEDDLNKNVDERVQLNLPPCFISAGGKASAPPISNPHRGDGRVWFQIVKHARTTSKPIIFVTGDVQPNWWRTARLGNQDRPIGPHIELIRDIESASGKRFAMYTQEQFLSEAPKYLDVPEQTQAIEEVRQIRENAAAELKDEDLFEETKSSPLEESSSLDKAETASISDSMEKDTGLLDEPKTIPLEESPTKGKSESKGEVK
jgi:predicted nucleic acid-binding protein